MTDIIEMFTEEPYTTPSGITDEEAAYNAAFRQRLPDILKQRKIAQEASGCDVAINKTDIRTVYEGILTWHEGERWFHERTQTVIWTRVWDVQSVTSMAA